MKSILFRSLLTLTIASSSFYSFSQLSISIAIDENRSAEAYHVAWGEENAYEAKKKARAALKADGHEKLTAQPCNSCGHDLEAGVYVLLKVKYKIYDGTERIGYGLGASESSYVEAEANAEQNLKTYHSSWKSSDGYDVEKKGKFGKGIFNGAGEKLMIVVFAHKDGESIEFDRALQLWEHHEAYEVLQGKFKSIYGDDYIERTLVLDKDDLGAAVEFSKTVNGKTIKTISLIKNTSDEDLATTIEFKKNKDGYTQHKILTQVAEKDDISYMQQLMNLAITFLREHEEDVDDSKLEIKGRQACMCIRG